MAQFPGTVNPATPLHAIGMATIPFLLTSPTDRALKKSTFKHHRTLITFEQRSPHSGKQLLACSVVCHSHSGAND